MALLLIMTWPVAGCVTMVAGAAAGAAGGYTGEYVSRAHQERAYPVSYGKARETVLKVFDYSNLILISEKQRESGEDLKASTLDGNLVVTVTLSRLAVGSIYVSVYARNQYYVPDKANSVSLMARIDQHLEGGSDL